VAIARIIFEIKRAIGRKSLFFHTPAFDASVRGVSVEILPYRFIRKSRLVRLQDDAQSLMTRLAISIEYRRVIDRPTEGQTGRQRDRHLATA